MLHLHSAHSAAKVRPFVFLVLYCCVHTLHAQLYRSAHLFYYCRIAAITLCALSCTGQPVCMHTIALLHPHSACSAVQVSPFVFLLLYCCSHTLHAQLCMSGHLYSYYCIAASTLCALTLYRSIKLWSLRCTAASILRMLSCASHLSCCPSVAHCPWTCLETS